MTEQVRKSNAATLADGHGLTRLHPAVRASFIPFPEGEWTEADFNTHFPGWRKGVDELNQLRSPSSNTETAQS